jgi:2-amino-4-hydroxy-6-hydroxymethyldihydropteridine diphosphokinase
MTDLSSIAFLCLGSNLGDRDAHLARARQLLEEHGAQLRRQSKVIETDPWGIENQPQFLNQVVEVAWPRGPLALLSATRAVEATVGRTPTYRWGPREIDIDILMFDDLVVFEPNLEIPHPRMWERDFVLRPLRELVPGVGT